MNKSEKKEIEKWVKTWEQAGSALDKVKLEELRAPDYYRRNQEFLNEMLQYAYEHRQVRLSSGLVEQQKLFMKRKRQMEKMND